MGETPEPLKRRLGRKAAEMEKWSFLQRRVVKLRTTAGKKHEESASRRGAEERLSPSPSSGSDSAGIIETSRKDQVLATEASSAGQSGLAAPPLWPR